MAAAKPTVEPKDTAILEQARARLMQYRTIYSDLVPSHEQVWLAEKRTSSKVVISELAAVHALPVQPSNTFTIQTADVPDLVSEMIGQVNQAQALTDLRRLTGEEPICTNGGCYTITNRLTGSEGLQRAKDYIYRELLRSGYSVTVEDWSRSGYSDQNLIVRKSGVSFPNEEIYLVAHVDGVKKDLLSRFPAADDNASGVVDLLELARALSTHSFNRSVVLLFSTAEEQGSLGVRSHIEQLTPEELSSVKYVFNIDMVGYDANHDRVMELWHGGHPPSLDLAQLMGNTIEEYQLQLAPRLVVGCG